MSTWTTTIACALIAFAPAAYADKATAKTEAVTITPKDVKWGDPPPDLPKGAQFGVLHGDPTKAGTFTVRLKLPDGYKIPAHWHGKDEELTILSGALQMYMGDTMTGEPHILDAGSYHFLPAKSRHVAQAKGETIVQLSGAGPFDIHYINAADNPNPKSAKR